MAEILNFPDPTHFFSKILIEYLSKSNIKIEIWISNIDKESFYFHYIRDNKGRDEHYWSNTLDAPARKIWAGNMFEQVCKDHIGQIKQKIGILGILSNESTWFVKADKKLGTAGTQIDLIIDRRDRVINLCEMKFSLSEYTIDKDYDEKLRKRIETFRKKTGTKKAIQIVFVTAYGVEENILKKLALTS